jgi:hypothetical protein
VAFVLQLIFSGEYTKAMSKDWHSGHFCCWQCDESLTGQRYVLRDDHPYCIKCYESVFANVCEECNKTIGIDSKVRQWMHITVNGGLMEVKLHYVVVRLLGKEEWYCAMVTLEGCSCKRYVWNRSDMCGVFALVDNDDGTYPTSDGGDAF